MELQSFFSFVFSADPIVVTLAVVVLVLFVQTIFLTERLKKLTQGSTGASLEHIISDALSRVQRLEEHGKTTELALNNVDERLGTAVRAVVVRRFDPYENAGGQQSFATALLNESGDGVVLSGIHSRDSVRVYAKDVHEFVSERELSPDEVQVLVDAKKSLQ